MGTGGRRAGEGRAGISLSPSFGSRSLCPRGPLGPLPASGHAAPRPPSRGGPGPGRLLAGSWQAEHTRGEVSRGKQGGGAFRDGRGGG